MLSKTLFAVLAIAVLTAVTIGAAARAGPVAARDPDAPSRRVWVGDLDLNRPAAVKIAIRRIRIAAADVCGLEDPIRLDRLAEVRSCVRDATDHAIIQLRSPLATAAHVSSPGAPG